MSQHSIKNSLSLIANIKDVVPPFNSSLIFFDVVALFPHNPKTPTLQHIGLLVAAPLANLGKVRGTSENFGKNKKNPRI